MDREKVQEHILYNTGYKIEFTTTTKTKTASSEKKASRSTLARLQIQRCENKNIYSSSNTSLSVCVSVVTRNRWAKFYTFVVSLFSY